MTGLLATQRCSKCGAVDHWGPGWIWYGRIDGPPEKILCPACSAAIPASDVVDA